MLLHGARVEFSPGEPSFKWTSAEHSARRDRPALSSRWAWAQVIGATTLRTIAAINVKMEDGATYSIVQRHRPMSGQPDSY